MGKNLKYFAFAVLALLGYSYIAKANAGKKIKVNFHTLKLLASSGLNLPTIQAIFSLQNPTSQQITINSLVGTIYVNGQELSNVTSFSKITIPGNNEIFLPINIKTGIISAVKNVIALLKKKNKITVSFKGTVNAENFTIPIAETIII